jgi:hypothetical protein
MDRAMSFRIWEQLTGRRERRAYSQPIDANNVEALVNSIPTQDVNQGRDDNSETMGNTPAEYIENREPLRRRIISRARRAWIVRKLIAPLINWWREKNRPLTQDEINQREQAKIDKQIAKVQERDAIEGSKRILEVLTRLGFCHRQSVDGTQRITDKFTIDMILIYPHAIFYHVDHYPYGEQNKAANILNESVLSEIARSVGHQTYGHDDPDTGVVFIVELASTAGIPDLVQFSDVMKTRPASASDLSIPIGISAGGRPIWRDIDDAPHWLVAGLTGMGKSNIENAWLGALLSSGVSPERVRMLFVDVKRTELTPYKGLPHLLAGVVDGVDDGIAKTPEDALKVIKYARQECDKRQRIFEGKYNDIRDYNKRNKKAKMPFILVWIDEIGNIALTPKIGMAFNEELVQLTNISRALGVYVLMFTQKPQANVIDTRITFNTDGRLAFNCPTHASSTMIINDGSAVGLPIGRAVFNMRDTRAIVQTPRITTSVRRSIVADILAGREVSPDFHSLLEPEEVVKWSADQNNGSLRFDDAFRKFGEQDNRISKNDLTIMLQNMDGNVYEADGLQYKVLAPRGRYDRKLQIISENAEQIQTNPVAIEPVFSGRDTGDEPDGDSSSWDEDDEESDD